MRVEESYEINKEIIEFLEAIYVYESGILNKNLSVGKNFSVEWTKDILIDVLDGSEKDALQLLEELDSKNRLVKLFSKDGDIRAYRTDTAELVRLSTFNYNRYPESKTNRMISTQCGVTWEIESKKTPKWEMTISEVSTKLKSEIINGWIDEESGAKHNYVNSELVNAINIVSAAYNELQRSKYGIEGMLSGFQFRSVRAMLRGMYSTGDKTLAILAGTGSGKSYGFQIGSLISIVEQRLAGTLNKTHSIFLYPRVALMNDQRKAMEELLDRCNLLLNNEQKIRWVTDGDSRLKDDYKIKINPAISDRDFNNISAPRLIKEFYGSKEHCPHIVFANPDTITNRLTSSLAIDGLTSELRNIVFDEVHLLESITGANTSGVIRRLCAHTGNRELMLTGSSATIADEKEHLSKVFARNKDQVIVVEPKEEEKELTGIIHHVFHKAVEGSSFKTNLVNLTSLVSHQRRRRKTEDVNDPGKSHKTIGFADSLNLIGSWNFLLRDNEGLELRKGVRAKIKNGEDASKLVPESMPLPYRFDKPLIHISELNISSIKKEDAEKHCNACISGNNSTLLVEDASVFQYLSLDSEPKRNKKEKLGVIENSYEGQIEIGVTDRCPYFECGACWREERDYKPILLFPEGPKLYSNSIRPIRLTSQSIKDKGKKLKENPEKRNQELEHFSIDLDEYHNIKREITRSGKSIPNNQQIADIALGSPAIEVGMDFENALDAVMFKAIRNVSSYRQKVGRLGRERYRDVYSSMLTSFRAVDYHYYRNPQPLLDNKRLDPIPLNVENEMVRKQIAYMAVYDDIAKNGGNLASSLHNIREKDRYAPVVNAAVSYLEDDYEKIAIRMKKGLREPNISICKEAIDKVVEHLKFLVRDISPLLTSDDKCLADRIGKRGYVEKADYKPGLQKIYLSNEGNAFVEIATCIDDGLREIALNRHHDDYSSPEITEMIDIAVDIWDKINKGQDSPKLGEFIREYLTPEVVVAAFPLGELGISILSLSQQKSTLDKSTPYVQKLIHEGQISLAKSINAWNKEVSNRTTGKFRIWYLRDLFSTLHFTKHDLPFVFQKTLFKPPNEKTVEVWVPSPKNEDDWRSGKSDEIPIREVLFAHAPGMWNYRRASMPMKTSCYQQLQPTENGTHMNMPLNNIPGEDFIKHQFIKRSKIRKKDTPWNFSTSSEYLTLYEPEKIQLSISRGQKGGNQLLKGSCFNEKYTLIRDWDDTNEDNFTKHDDDGSEELDGESHKNQINVPECFPIGWRALEAFSSEPILPFNGPFEVEFENDILMQILFNGIEFAESVLAKEFILGATRKYQGGGELEIQYVDNKVSGKNVVIGDEYNTEGIRFVINKNTLKMASEWTSKQMLGKSGSHTIYQVLQYVLSKNLRTNRFVVDSLLTLTLYKLNYTIPKNIESWIKEISGLRKVDFIEFKKFWEEGGKKGMNLDSLQYQIEKIEANPNIIPEHLTQLTEDWSVRTYANSLAIHMLQGAREFTGSKDDDLGYHVECDEGIIDSNSNIIIWLYDRSPDGNGSCKTLKQWIQIPKVVRDQYEKSKERNLPSKDYIDIIEGSYLSPCKAHQAELIAHVCYKNGKDPREIKHVLSPDFVFSHENYSDYWKKLEERGYEKDVFPFVKLIIPLIYSEESEQEFFNRAIEGCHSSCVECLEEFGISMFGPLDSPNFANKRMISHVLTREMENNPDDYRNTEVTMKGMGASLSGIGNLKFDKSLFLKKDDKNIEVFVEVHPVKRWVEVDLENPLRDDGKIQSTVWTKMNNERWK